MARPGKGGRASWRVAGSCESRLCQVGSRDGRGGRSVRTNGRLSPGAGVVLGDSGERAQSFFGSLQLRQYSSDERRVQGRRTIIVTRRAVGPGAGGSETFSGARTPTGWSERRGATLPAAGRGHGSEGL